MVKENKETALIGTERGMCRIQMSSHNTTPIQFVGVSGETLPSPYIEQIIPYQNDSWLIATKEYGLFTLKPQSAIAKQLYYPGNKHVFFTAFVNNYLFLSIWDADPELYKIENGEWKRLKNPLSNFLVTYVLYDEKIKHYWIGTLKGLLEVDENLNILHHYTTDDGLSNHYIYAM